MKTPEQMVREFHGAFGAPIRTTPGIPPRKRRKLRRKLIREEYRELMRALRRNDLVGIADGSADLTVVVYGTELEYGIPADQVLLEVHASNMSKLGSDGKPIVRRDGKIMKGPGFFRPRIQEILEREAVMKQADRIRIIQDLTARRNQGLPCSVAGNCRGIRDPHHAPCADCPLEPRNAS